MISFNRRRGGEWSKFSTYPPFDCFFDSSNCGPVRIEQKITEAFYLLIYMDTMLVVNKA